MPLRRAHDDPRKCLTLCHGTIAQASQSMYRPAKAKGLIRRRGLQIDRAKVTLLYRELPSLHIIAQLCTAEDTLYIPTEDKLLGCSRDDPPPSDPSAKGICPAKGKLQLMGRDQDALL